ncbi:Ig-like domain-containing protein [Actinoplanes sp. NPDC049802]|uniref:Ig-like domain-containing protein n=1 Tax=Actinoplanes sp. NPDC049802 TaxID=3154742 RepID=UPI0033CE73E7
MRLRLPILASGLVAGLIVGSAAVPAAAAAASSWYNVGLTEGTDPAAVIADLKDRTISASQVENLPVVRVEVSETAVAELKAKLAADTARVRFVEPDARISTTEDPGRAYADPDLGPSKISGARTWTTGDPEIVVAVLDTGVTPGDEIGADRLVAGRDFVDGDDDASDGLRGTGTETASYISAATDSKIMPVRVLGVTPDDGTQPGVGSISAGASGIAWAADHGAKVIHVGFSLDRSRRDETTSLDSEVLRTAVEYAAGKGALVVAPANGHYDESSKKAPAQYEPALAVGHPGVAYSGDWVDLTTTGWWGPAYVSGAAALAMAQRPDASAAKIRSALIAGGSAPGLAGQPPQLDAAKVVYALGGTDDVAPKITATGLTEDELIGAAGKKVTAKATDDHAIQRIDWLIDGKVVASSTDSGVETTLVPAPGTNGVKKVTAKVYDYAGNVDETTTDVRVDTSVPVVSITSPRFDEVQQWGSDVEVTVTTDATDIASMEVRWSPETRRPMTQVAGTNRWTGKVKSVQGGRITVWAVDTAGNTTEVELAIKSDWEGPTGGRVSPADSTRVGNSFSTTLSGITDPSGIARAEVVVNGKVVATDKAAPYTATVRTGSTTGKFQYAWRVFDKWNNVRTYTRTVIADNKVPAVSITKAPKNKAKVKGTVKVYVKASDASGIARVELLVNGKVVARDAKAAYVLAFNASKQKKTMKVQVRAYDRFGNVTYTTTRTWYRK